MDDVNDSGESQTLLIAGCGYLGQRVAEAWLQRGHRVAAVTRSEQRAAQLRAEGIEPLVLDLAHPDDGVKLPAASCVLWAVGYDRSADVSRETVWLDGLRWFINQLPPSVRRFAYVSSTSVYGNNDGQQVDESTPTDPQSEGGRCCVQAEQIVRQAFGSDDRATVLRLAGIYGPNRLLRKVSDLKAGHPMPGDPEAWLNLIHVDDAVRMVETVFTMESPPALLNVVNSGTVTRREYYTTLARLVDAPEPTFEHSSAGSGQSRGGNKKVVSSRADQLAASYLFDDVRAGLADAVRRSNDLIFDHA